MTAATAGRSEAIPMREWMMRATPLSGPRPGQPRIGPSPEDALRTSGVSAHDLLAHRVGWRTDRPPRPREDADEVLHYALLAMIDIPGLLLPDAVGWAIVLAERGDYADAVTAWSRHGLVSRGWLLLGAGLTFAEITARQADGTLPDDTTAGALAGLRGFPLVTR